MGEPRRIWKVFFPQDCLRSASGICLGWTCIQRQVICIVGIAHTTNKDISHHLSHLDEPGGSMVHVVGVWSNEAFGSPFQGDRDEILESSTFGCKLILNQYHYDGIPTCTLYAGNGDTRASQNTLFILYAKKQLIASKPDFWSRHISPLMKDHPVSQLDKTNAAEMARSHRTDIEEIIYVAQRSLDRLKKLKSDSNIKLCCEMLMEERKSWTRNATSFFFHLCSLPLRLVFTVFNTLFDNR